MMGLSIHVDGPHYIGIGNGNAALCDHAQLLTWVVYMKPV